MPTLQLKVIELRGHKLGIIMRSVITLLIVLAGVFFFNKDINERKEEQVLQNSQQVCKKEDAKSSM